MAKVLKVKFPEKCIGCDLCVLEAQKQLKKVGLDGAPLRVFKNKEELVLLGDISFEIDLDPQVNELNIKRIEKICPTGVFTVEETAKPNEENLLE
jgi:ferredoxin